MAKNRKPPKSRPRAERFAWFFGYHVFDLVRAREIAEAKPILTLTTVNNFAPLAEDGYVDRDAVPFASVFEPVTIGPVPMGNGLDRYVLLDGYEVVARCVELAKPLRLRLLSRNEMKRCRIDSESLGEWA